MKLFLIAAVALAALACEKPCVLECTSDSDCPIGVSYCGNNRCLPKCINCGGQCVVTLHDNCQACGVACAASQVCKAKQCVDSCGADQVPCNGACTDLRTDPFNCGSCGNACGMGQGCATVNDAGVCTSVNTC